MSERFFAYQSLTGKIRPSVHIGFAHFAPVTPILIFARSRFEMFSSFLKKVGRKGDNSQRPLQPPVRHDCPLLLRSFMSFDALVTPLFADVMALLCRFMAIRSAHISILAALFSFELKLTKTQQQPTVQRS
jgi:hypothetical protein